MYDQVINDGTRRHYEPPAEMQVIILRTGTPAAAGVAYLDAFGNKLEGLAEMIDSFPDIFLRAFPVPVDKELLSLKGAIFGKDKLAAKEIQFIASESCSPDLQRIGFPQEEKYFTFYIVLYPDFFLPFPALPDLFP
jgi:hypothetical protein